MRRPFVCALFALLSIPPLLAHHSAAGIDRTKSVTVAGTIKEFRWANPHSWIDVDVPNDKGGTVTWSVEMTSPTFLVRAGWKSTERTKAHTSFAPCSRSMPMSSHSTESGPV